MKFKRESVSSAVAVLSLTLLLLTCGVSSAAQLASTTPAMANIGIGAPTWPSSGADFATWQTFSSAEFSFTAELADQLTGLNVTVPDVGSCVVGTPTTFPFNGSAIGAPVGVTLYGLTGGISCKVGIATSKTKVYRSSSVRPRTAGCNSSSISFGTQYTGIASDCISGFPSGDAIGWFLDTSGSNKGHEELSNAGLTCAPGTLIGNSADGTLTPGSGYYVMTPLDPNGDVNYGGTWWRDNGGGSYTDMVTVCDSV